MTESMQRKCISSVKPLDGYVLQVDFISEGRLLLPMEKWLDSIRFAPLRDWQIWQSATTNGLFVRFGNVEISHDELLDMVEFGRSNYGIKE